MNKEKGEIIIYQPDDNVKLEVRAEDEEQQHYRRTQPYPRPNVEKHAVRLASEAFCNHFVVIHNCCI